VNESVDSVNLDGKSILITGGTGSFGHAFARRILDVYSPKRVIIFSRDEYKQYVMQQSFSDSEYPNIRFFIGDIRDQERLSMALKDIDIVIHAAAMKHVGAAEYNPFECIKTNVIGAENLVKASISAGVKQVLALSTDKAVNPVNLYGASKLAADKIFVAANALSGAEGTRFSIVRYGNVLGSRGSVVPFFQKLIAEDASFLPITDPRMTRFWVTLDQGVDFVLSCLSMMRAGEIFVPKIASMKMTDLAAAMAPNVSQEIIGIRPGEKLHEIMIADSDSQSTVELTDRYIIEPGFASWERKSFVDDGFKKVVEGFEYSSNTNTKWLGAKELLKLLAFENEC
jgi:UDP-N-acetylglucosamine 4,6-dehydratase